MQALIQTPSGPAVRTTASEKEWDFKPYLRYLANECNRLRLSAIDPRYVTPAGESKITLVQVYTDLEVETTVPVEPEKGGEKNAGEEETALLQERGESRRMTALEAVSAPQAQRIVLLGAPGAGKTTFTNYLTLCLIMAALESEQDWLK